MHVYMYTAHNIVNIKIKPKRSPTCLDDTLQLPDSTGGIIDEDKTYSDDDGWPSLELCPQTKKVSLNGIRVTYILFHVLRRMYRQTSLYMDPF